MMKALQQDKQFIMNKMDQLQNHQQKVIPTKQQFLQ